MAEVDRHAARAKMAKVTHAQVAAILVEVKAHITAGTEDAQAQTKLDTAIAALTT